VDLSSGGQWAGESCRDPPPSNESLQAAANSTENDRAACGNDHQECIELHEAAAVSVSVDAGADPASGPSEGPCKTSATLYVDDDFRPISPLEQEGLASTPALAQPHSHHDPPGSSQDQISQHNDDGIGGTPDERESGGGSNENASELERDMQLAFEEQEKSSSALALGSPRPRRPSSKPPHPHTKQEHDRGGTNYSRLEELGRGPPCRSQDRGKEA